MTPRKTNPVAAPLPLHYALARRELGVKERVGHEDNPRILEYLKATGLPEHLIHDSTAHCAAFVCWCLREAKLPNPGYAQARNFLKYGLPLTKPRVGCIAVLWRVSPSGPHGHVAFWVKHSAEREILFGANQHNEVCEALYPRARVLGYRWPPGVALK